MRTMTTTLWGGLFESALLVSVALVLLVHADNENVQGNSTCDDGWIPYDGNCYLMRDEYESAAHAEHSCALFGATRAYGKTKKEMAFIKSLVSEKNAYGWWYGLYIDFTGDPRAYSEEKGYFAEIKDPDVPLPKVKDLSAPSTSCVGVIRDNGILDVDYVMVDVPCDVTLPYACRGDASDASVLKNEHDVMDNGTNDVFWFSSLWDRRSHDDATKACADKSMTLMSIRGDLQAKFIAGQLDKRQDSHVDPWWTGLRVDHERFSWSSGVVVEPSVINWSRDSEGLWGKYRRQDCRLLHSDGTFDDRKCHVVKAPFICKKAQGLTGKFGCPHTWLRAGESCYLHVTTRGVKTLTYTDAERLCSKNGGHPISVDTPIEKLWLRHRSVFDYNSAVQIWTSLKNRTGHFVWADGKAPSPEVLTWSKGFTMKGSGQCFAFTSVTNTLQRANCGADKLFSGCQYPASGQGECVTEKWKHFKGFCYYSPSSGFEREPYRTMLQKCYENVLTVNNDIVLSPLKVDNFDLIDFYSKNIHYGAIWLGLREASNGVFTWSDGTLANISMFNTEDYHHKNYDSPNACAVMDGSGDFEKMSCTSCSCAETICEIEVPYQHQHQSPSGNGATVSSVLLSPTLFIVGTLLTLSRLDCI